MFATWIFVPEYKELFEQSSRCLDLDAKLHDVDKIQKELEEELQRAASGKEMLQKELDSITRQYRRLKVDACVEAVRVLKKEKATLSKDGIKHAQEIKALEDAMDFIDNHHFHVCMRMIENMSVQ
ncbi:hypothetical protein GUITHDRAFT_117721 [Guillardia theta CCMP2712]|uniref:Uncharacterized protein n=1 Tax=Guillardia theta (strain CCMP2712) TaxID=905079 RepID=L1IJA7_GUITC|nr:hypothetical protein GUITHDRAFT_117721 [Guillardia theta CCMP2712]EKX36197.1 hypothetical protein GUITHDRAFT_117721 [Guillardia theta CCMP2712]|eukprot:XP_005823177.1 hypothetical protein GUITHDRAFT_117721 [Guillardia theta CCMP2712]